MCGCVFTVHAFLESVNSDCFFLNKHGFTLQTRRDMRSSFHPSIYSSCRGETSNQNKSLWVFVVFMLFGLQ